MKITFTNKYFTLKGFSEIRQFARKAITRYDYAQNLAPLKYDGFMCKKLPVPKCAGSFYLSPFLRSAFKNIDVHSLEILVNKKLNRIKIKDQPILTKEINKFIKQFPEFMYVFAPQTRYKGGLDKHVLATYQQLIIHPQFKRLSYKDQEILEIAALLHDVGKAIDLGSTHPRLSAKIVVQRIGSLPIDKKSKRIILKLIKHHHYSENIAKKRMNYEDYVEILSEKEFNLLKILTDADIKSKNKPVQYRLDENEKFFREQAIAYKTKSQTKKRFELIA